jgi:hypothetical protein
MLAPNAVARLRAAHLRVTRPRIGVLDVVSAHPHADTETIFTGTLPSLPARTPKSPTAAGVPIVLQPWKIHSRKECGGCDQCHTGLIDTKA